MPIAVMIAVVVSIVAIMRLDLACLEILTRTGNWRLLGRE